MIRGSLKTRKDRIAILKKVFTAIQQEFHEDNIPTNIYEYGREARAIFYDVQKKVFDEMDFSLEPWEPRILQPPESDK